MTREGTTGNKHNSNNYHLEWKQNDKFPQTTTFIHSEMTISLPSDALFWRRWRWHIPSRHSIKRFNINSACFPLPVACLYPSNTLKTTSFKVSRAEMIPSRPFSFVMVVKKVFKTPVMCSWLVGGRISLTDNRTWINLDINNLVLDLLQEKRAKNKHQTMMLMQTMTMMTMSMLMLKLLLTMMMMMMTLLLLRMMMMMMMIMMTMTVKLYLNVKTLKLLHNYCN